MLLELGLGLGAAADWDARDSESTGTESVPDSLFSVIGKGLRPLCSISKLLCQMAETPRWATGCLGAPRAGAKVGWESQHPAGDWISEL